MFSPGAGTWKSAAVNAARRFFCLPRQEPPARERLKEEEQPHTLRQTLYPLTFIFTACYLVLEFREFFSAAHPTPQFTPELYQGLLVAYGSEQEVRRWKGKPDWSALGAQFIIYAWFLLYIGMAMTINFYPDAGWRMPKDLGRICTEALIVLCGLGASRYLHARRARLAATETGFEEQILDYVRDHGRITSAECASLLGLMKRQAQRTLIKMAEKGLVEPDEDRHHPNRGYRLPKT